MAQALALACFAFAATAAPPPPGDASRPALPPAGEGGDATAERVVHRVEGRFSTIFVVDRGRDRFLRFGAADGDDQTWIDREDPRALPMEYLRSAAVGLALQPKSVLLVGLGGGGFATFAHQVLPGSAVSAVEIDPHVVAVARSHFGLPPSVEVAVADGAAFLQKDERRYGLILVDAYGADDYPQALGTQAFFADVFARLSDDGAAVLNIAVDDGAVERRLIRRFALAAKACFILPVEGTDPGNVVVLGTRGPLTAEELEERARAFEGRAGLPLGALAAKASACSQRAP